MNPKHFNISICSYNVNWKVMTSAGTNAQNVIENISRVKNYYNPFIYCFQEASNYTSITQLFERNLYDMDIGKSGPEHILTIWNKKIMRKMLSFTGEFEHGRPFTIIVFQDLRFSNYFMLINIHANHDSRTQMKIFDPIQKLIDKHINHVNKYPIQRICIVGDFNRDISLEHVYSLALKTNSTSTCTRTGINKYIFHTLKTSNKTCCSMSNSYPRYVYNYDHVIDSWDIPIQIFSLTNEKWYRLKSSDHALILCVIKNIL